MTIGRNRAGSLRYGVCALLAFPAAGCKGAQSDAAAADAQPVVTAQIAEVKVRPFTEHLGVLGSVVPRPGHVAVLSAPAPTRIAQVFVATGQPVRRGAPLVAFEQAMFLASAQSAQAALVASERNYERAQRLVEAGVAPRKDLDQAQADLARARAEAVMARRNAELSVLRSPIAGVVTRMSAVLGASADANQPLVEVADPSMLDIMLGVTPSEAGRIQPRAPVEFRAGERDTGESLGAGVIVDVGSAVDSATRTVPVRAQATKPSRTLRIGETVRAQITVGTHPNALTVPIQALVPEGDGFKVFVVDSNGVAHSRPVVVVARSDSLAEIGSGVTAGERVVTAGAYGVEDSTKIVPGKP
jgi:RND family efflux transporter MFP subunit